MQKRASVYPIYELAHPFMEKEFFDLSLLPFKIMEDVAIEPVTAMLKDSLDLFSKISAEKLDQQRSVQFALVHRYESKLNFRGSEDDQSSIQLLYNLAACLRLVRPMRQPAGMM